MPFFKLWVDGSRTASVPVGCWQWACCRGDSSPLSPQAFPRKSDMLFCCSYRSASFLVRASRSFTRLRISSFRAGFLFGKEASQTDRSLQASALVPALHLRSLPTSCFITVGAHPFGYARLLGASRVRSGFSPPATLPRNTRASTGPNWKKYVPDCLHPLSLEIRNPRLCP